MGTLLVAHGTRSEHGVAMVGDLAAAMSAPTCSGGWRCG